MSLITSTPSPFLSRTENNQADRAAFDTLQRKQHRLQEYIKTFNDQKPSAAGPAKTALQEKITKFQSLLTQIEGNIAQITHRSLGTKKLELPPIPQDLLQTKIGLEKKIALLQEVKQFLETHRNLSADDKKKIIVKLPQALQWAFHGDVYNFHPAGEKKDYDGKSWGAATFEADPRLIITLKNKDGVSLLDAKIMPLIHELEKHNTLLQPHFPVRAQAFTQLVQSNDFNHDVLKNLYDFLEDETKKLISHKPPYFGIGVNAKLHEKMGAHIHGHNAVDFSVFAPHAKQVFLVITSNGGDVFDQPWTIPLEKEMETGNWRINVPDLREGSGYYYLIETKDGHRRKKIDPFSFAIRPSKDREIIYESMVKDLTHHRWNDGAWINRRLQNLRGPMNIYEVHPTLWKKNDHGGVLNWRDLAPPLIRHCKEHHFTHVELMALLDHPDHKSRGYQVFGFFAPNHRLGTFEDAQYFIDQMHQADIGVIVDWVPNHFAIDSCGLEQFDGTPLFEKRNLIEDDLNFHPIVWEKDQNYNSPILRKSRHPEWNSFEFDFSQEQSCNFLYSSADFWLDKLHLDGIRIDAVSSMIYLNFDREAKNFKWMRSIYDDNVNQDALNFMRNLNAYIHRNPYYRGVKMIAEESTGYRDLTTPVDNGGVGFDNRWEMGWMNRALKGFQDSNFGETSFSHYIVENCGICCLPLSHDETKSFGGSLYTKMPGEWQQKFARVRNLLSYQMCLPGSKLNMMGNEYAQPHSWDANIEAPNEYDRFGMTWAHLRVGIHHEGVSTMMKTLGKLYKEQDALWLHDGNQNAMSDVFCDKEAQVIRYSRQGSTKHLFIVHNFSPHEHLRYHLTLPPASIRLREIFNSDEKRFGGAGTTNPLLQMALDREGKLYTEVRLPANSTMIVENR